MNRQSGNIAEGVVDAYRGPQRRNGVAMAARGASVEPVAARASKPSVASRPVADAGGDASCKAIRAAVSRIPRGHVASYGEIATRAGLPRRARLVGKVLRDTPDDIVLPWHRVVRADGSIAFPARSAEFREQKRRLALEGVSVDRGRVDLDQFGWERNLDAALWAPR